MYEYRKSLKSPVSDEIINTWFIRPVAGLIVRILYHTPVTPNQLTIASTLVGLVAALVFSRGEPAAVASAGLLVTVKDILDSADGQLARAKQMYSRSGRFLDSIGDFVVDVAVFAAIGWVLWNRTDNGLFGLLAFSGLLGTTFRVSYHVFYQTSFLHRRESYQTNRVTEEVREEDVKGERSALVLQRIFQAVYGWQDRLVLRIDRWCRGWIREEKDLEQWYSNETALRLSGFLGMGTELFLLMLFSIANRVEEYVYFNLLAMNCLLAANILYRKYVLAASVRAGGEN